MVKQYNIMIIIIKYFDTKTQKHKKNITEFRVLAYYFLWFHF